MISDFVIEDKLCVKKLKINKYKKIGKKKCQKVGKKKKKKKRERKENVLVTVK
jgi:hypothetical protein